MGNSAVFPLTSLGKRIGKLYIRAVDTVACWPPTMQETSRPRRQIQGSLNGRELGLYDNYYEKICADERRDLALNAAVWPSKGKAWKLISEEGEYSDSLDFSYVIDSGGLRLCTVKRASPMESR